MDDHRGTLFRDGLTFIPFNPLNPKGTRSQALSGQPEHHKKRLATAQERANIRTVKAKGACLRCKILKKQCDDEQPCKQCPKQSLESLYNHWQVLGCQRGELSSLAGAFIPSWISRKSLAAAAPGNSTLGSPLLQREALLVNKRKLEMTFSRLSDSGRMAANELICLRDIDIAYCIETAYNPRTLLQSMQNAESRDVENNNLSDNSNIWKLSRKMIIEACTAYRRVKHGIEQAELDLANMTDIDTIYSASNLKGDLEKCLEFIESTCSKRGSIESTQWPCLFYLLNAISVVKSLMIDMCSLGFEDPDSDALRIESTYYALVRLFLWATGSFDPLTNDYGGAVSLDSAANFIEARELVHFDDWSEWNIKTTKDYFMGLGKGFIRNGKYCGYVVQEKGLLQKIIKQGVGGLFTNEVIVKNDPIVEYMLQKLPFKDILKLLPFGKQVEMMEYLSTRKSLDTKESERAITRGIAIFKSASRTTSPKSSRFDVTESEGFEAHSLANVSYKVLVQKGSSNRLPTPIELTPVMNSLAGPVPGASLASSDVGKQALQRDMASLSLAPATSDKKVQRQFETGLRSRSIAMAEAHPCNNSTENRTASFKSAVSSLQNSVKSHRSSMSISSCLQEDITMTGTPPSSYRSLSTSNQSGTSLQRLEARFMRDFRCCGHKFPTLHELLGHNETCHEQNRLNLPVSIPKNAYKSQIELQKPPYSPGDGLESQKSPPSSSAYVQFSNVQLECDQIMRQFSVEGMETDENVEGEELFQCAVFGCFEAYNNIDELRYINMQQNSLQAIANNMENSPVCAPRKPAFTRQWRRDSLGRRSGNPRIAFRHSR